MKLSIILFTVLLLILYNTQPGICDNILYILTCAGYSHRVAHWPLVEALLAKGHHVTFISPKGPKVPENHPNLTDIVPKRLQKFIEEFVEGNFDVHNRAYGLSPPFFLAVDYCVFYSCSELYKSEEVKKWLATSPKVDLVVADVMPDCSYGFAEKFKAKNVLYLPIPFVIKHFESFGINSESHSIPDFDFSGDVPLTFLKRLFGTLLPFYYRFVEMLFYSWYQDLFLEELGIKNISDMYEIRDTTSLIIINGDYISDYPRSFPPYVIKVPGIHVKDPLDHKPLDANIEKFIESEDSEGNKSDGFIYISFGTLAEASKLPLEVRESFYKSIKAFPRIRFIWKWDGNKPEEYPKNLMLVKWVDQQSLLAHPKIKAFLTQAGRPSTQEALYNGVPTITFPICADQDFNAQRSKDLGTSISLEISSLSQEKLQNAISLILTDNSFKSRSVQLAKLAKDVPMKPVDVALWWVEFVLRHTPEELKLMKSNSRHLTWFQKRELDVWAFITFCLVTYLAILYYILKRIYKKVFKRNDTKLIVTKKKGKKQQ